MGLLLLLLATGLLCSSPGRAAGRVFELPSGHVIDEQGQLVGEPAPVTATAEPSPEAALLYRPPGAAATATPYPGVAVPGQPAGGSRKPHRGPGVKMVVGGQSEEGVAKTTTLPIIK